MPSSDPTRREDSRLSTPARGVPRPLLPRLLTWAKRLAIAAVVLAAFSVLGLWLLIRHYESTLPPTRDLANYHPPQVTRVLARDGTLLGELFTERRTVVDIQSVPSEMKLAVLAAEDAGFYEHKGLNYLGMLRALYVNLRGGPMQGGSTITQQVIKNVLLTPDRTPERKFREILLARRIETELSKDEILGLYLNHIYFGHGRYGVEEASRYYFGKPVAKITLAEATLLAGVVKGPSIYSPRVNQKEAESRRAYVLGQMVHKGFCTAEQAEAAKAEPVMLAPEVEKVPELAPEAIDEVKRTLRALVGAAADRGGYTVTTSIDPALQSAARAALRKNLDEFAKRKKLLAPLAKNKKGEAVPFEGEPRPGAKVYTGVVTGADDARGMLTVRVGGLDGLVALDDAVRYNPKGLSAHEFAEVGKVVRVSVRSGPAPAPTEQNPEATPGGDPGQPAPPRGAKLHLELGPQGAMVAIDVRTREVLALVGSYEAVRGGLDRATFASRQPGSTFKPFVYSYALHGRTLTPASIVETNPRAMAGYKPANYDESEGKTPKRLREALAQSVNVAAVWTMSQVGPSNVVAWAHAMGIESKLGADLSLALGSYEVTPRELVGAYATFAAGGVYEKPVLVTRIVGPNGVDVSLAPRAPPRRVMDEAEAYLTTSLLGSVVDHGTGKAARAVGRPVAGKTGTSNQAKDTWFAGYSTDIACVVWTGYDDAAPLGGGGGGHGGVAGVGGVHEGGAQEAPGYGFPDAEWDHAGADRSGDGQAGARGAGGGHRRALPVGYRADRDGGGCWRRRRGGGRAGGPGGCGGPASAAAAEWAGGGAAEGASAVLVCRDRMMALASR
ncbi:MAG: PBP1A family penicillin-binding protein [Polyangiaceae bacterium]